MGYNNSRNSFNRSTDGAAGRKKCLQPDIDSASNSQQSVHIGTEFNTKRLIIGPIT